MCWFKHFESKKLIGNFFQIESNQTKKKMSAFEYNNYHKKEEGYWHDPKHYERYIKYKNTCFEDYMYSQFENLPYHIKLAISIKIAKKAERFEKKLEEMCYKNIGTLQTIHTIRFHNTPKHFLQILPHEGDGTNAEDYANYEKELAQEIGSEYTIDSDDEEWGEVENLVEMDTEDILTYLNKKVRDECEWRAMRKYNYEFQIDVEGESEWLTEFVIKCRFFEKPVSNEVEEGEII